MSFDRELFNGLKALTEASFPKKCATCQRVYQTADEFIQQTQLVGDKSGLKSSIDDDDSVIVELFRNCVCGSTLMDCFKDRRGSSKRRDVFGKLLILLCDKGLEREHARTELLKVLHGESSQVIEDLGIKLAAPSQN